MIDISLLLNSKLNHFKQFFITKIQTIPYIAFITILVYNCVVISCSLQMSLNLILSEQDHFEKACSNENHLRRVESKSLLMMMMVKRCQQSCHVNNNTA